MFVCVKPVPVCQTTCGTGVVLGVGIGLFASCQLLHVLYVWVVGSGSLPFTCDSVDAEFNSIMYSCVHCVYMCCSFCIGV